MTERLGGRYGLASLCAISLVAVLVAGPVMMSAVMDRGHEIPKFLLVAPLAFVAFAAASIAFRWPDVFRAQPQSRVACFALGLFMVLGVISTLSAANPALAFFGGYYRLEGMLAWLAYAALFFSVLAWTGSGGSAQGLVDVMLLGSIIPAVYALQQGADLDFYVVAGRDLSRANGTQGNPVHLAEQMAFLLPLTLARVWLASGSLLRMLPWLVLALLQVAGLWATQTRGPFIAAGVGVLLLAIAGAAYTRRRFWILFTIGVGVTVAAFVVAVNFSNDMRSLAQKAPFLERVIFTATPGGDDAPNLASRSIVSRFGIWKAGVEAYMVAPFARQMLGYGPESAHQHYYPHVPPEVIQSEDSRVAGIFDRLHADSLDVLLNFGLIGWLAYLLFFGCVVLVGARRIFGKCAATSAFRFTWLTAGTALCCAGILVGTGLAHLALPGAALGAGGGCLIFVAIGAANWSRGESRPKGARQRGEWILVAGLMGSLISIWIDIQLNIPLLTARVMIFLVAAVLLAIPDDGSRPSLAAHEGKAENPSENWLICWAGSFALLAALSSFLPAVAVGSSGAGIPEAGLRLIPICAFLLILGLILLFDLKMSDARGWCFRLFVIVGIPVAYALCHLSLRVGVGPGFGQDGAAQLALLVAFGPALMLIACLLAPCFHAGDAQDKTKKQYPGAGLLGGGLACGGVSLACLSIVGAWQSLYADVLISSSRWSVVTSQSTVSQMQAKAVSLQPHEWQYRRAVIYRQIDTALVELGGPVLREGRLDGFRQAIEEAEIQAREAVRREPENPWALLSLAQVVQIRALRVLRSLDVAVGAAAELEADGLFRQLAKMYPAQPLIYRNWANLEFDRGLPEEGYRLFDVIEALVPRMADTYVERIQVAKRLGDSRQVQATYERAKARLDPMDFLKVETVAQEQRRP